MTNKKAISTKLLNSLDSLTKKTTLLITHVHHIYYKIKVHLKVNATTRPDFTESVQSTAIAT